MSDDRRDQRASERGEDREDAAGPVGGRRSRARGALEAGQEAVARPVGQTISAARAAIDRAGQAIGQGRAARVRRLRRLAKTPLPLLYIVHPEARRALPRSLGLRTIAITDIAGSAVEPTQRGGDFLPLPPLRTGNWRGRWQRLRKANDRLASLPPIDAIRFAGRYWVTDGHNRVSLGLYEDQPEIDANVTELHLPGEPVERAGALVPLLDEERGAGPRAFSQSSGDRGDQPDRQPPGEDRGHGPTA